MWSDRKQENSSFGPASESAGHGESSAEGVGTVSTLAVIGRGMVIKGQIKSREGLYIDGEVDGTLELFDSRLTVGPHGRVDADAKAREIEVLGSVSGDLEATKRITIRRGGRLVGDLRTPGIVIEEGAYFKGRIEIVSSEEESRIVAPQAGLKKTAAGL